MRGLELVVALAAGCGRIGFDSLGDDAQPHDGAIGDGAPNDGATIACVDMSLGSAVGPNVASGTTVGKGSQFEGCSGDGPDLSFGWIAPAAGTYRIDLCASPSGYDSTMAVLDGSCSGTELACDDDGCGGIGPSRLTVTLGTSRSRSSFKLV